MPLTDRQIIEFIQPRMKHPNETESTFCPRTSGAGIISYGLSSAGYDFRLGDKIKAFTGVHSPVVDPLKIDRRAFVDLVPERAEGHYLQQDAPDIRRQYRYVTIPPNGYVLAETVEYLEVPEDVLVVVLGKSTYARCGIIVNCTPLEPGWRGRTTLEIGNLSDVPARLYLGMGIAQALFFKLDEVPHETYANKGGRYQDQKGLEFSKVS